MTALVLAAKAALAVLLLAAGGAKLADLGGFAAAIRLFVPARAPAEVRALVPAAAAAVVAAELAAGTISLCWPAVAWANRAVLALACAFTVVAGLGYALHRGRPCRCFGALTRRAFSVRSILQSTVILAAAALAIRPAGQTPLSLGVTAHVLLLAAAGLMALAAHTAARALANPAESRTATPGVAT
jgi:hypothetical protein